jgi:hypothetical protein
MVGGSGRPGCQEAGGQGLQAALGLFSILAPKYLGATGTNWEGGGDEEAVLPRFVLLSSILRGGGEAEWPRERSTGGAGHILSVALHNF